MASLLASPFFGLTLTLVCWCVGLWVQNKTGWLLASPMLIALVLTLAVLLVFDIPFATYQKGGIFIHTLLGPVTVLLGLKIFQERETLREHFLPVLLGCLVGSLASLGSVVLLGWLFSLDSVIVASMLPKSVTTAIAIGIAESRGGLGGLASVGVMVAGLMGAVLSPAFAKLFHITDPVAEGVAIGACSHALGTTRALRIGAVQGAMSSISLCVCGIITSILMLFF